MKGVDVLIEAFKILLSRGRRSHLVIAGGPNVADHSDQPTPEGLSYLSELRAMLPAERCSWVGHKLDVRPLYHAADVAVLPSRSGEAFGRAVLEPMSSGIPVLGSADGGIPEALTAPFADFMFEVGDAGALAEKLGQLEDWRERSPELGNRCRDHIVRNFPLTKELDSVERLFVDAVAARTRSLGFNSHFHLPIS
jgi:glycosyltransferase involved in cell wall biosynthesis